MHNIRFIRKLNKSELEGVIAHELSHIKNYDIRVMSIVVVLVGLITLLTDFLCVAYGTEIVMIIKIPVLFL